MRRVLVMYSNFRGNPTVHRWNGQSLTWDDVTPGDVAKMGDRWEDLEAGERLSGEVNYGDYS